MSTSKTTAESDLVQRIRSEASISARPGSLDRLEAIAVEVEALESQIAEVRKRLDEGFMVGLYWQKIDYALAAISGTAVGGGPR